MDPPTMTRPGRKPVTTRHAVSQPCQRTAIIGADPPVAGPNAPQGL